jgi:hypothetical protein
MSQVQADDQLLVDRLHEIAQGLIAQDAFLPFGASISQGGEFVLEYVPPAASGLETRKAVHRKLVQIARSGQARAVAICHSLDNPAGAYLVTSVDHAQDKPVTYLFPIQEVDGREQIAAQPIVQQAAYTFFGFVDVPAAQRMLPGKWVQEARQGVEPDEVTYDAKNTLQRARPLGVEPLGTELPGTGHTDARQTGLWAVDEGDFYTNLVEFEQGSGSPTRVARIIELTKERLVLHEVSSGVVTASVYRRTG